jgi:hypothetical protein
MKADTWHRDESFPISASSVCSEEANNFVSISKMGKNNGMVDEINHESHTNLELKD